MDYCPKSVGYKKTISGLEMSRNISKKLLTEGFEIH